jgi:hypothetical protein
MLTNITSYKHASSGSIFNRSTCNRVNYSEALKFHGIREKKCFIRQREVVKTEEYITMLLFLSKTRMHANFNDNGGFFVSIGESSYDVVLWER